MKKIPLTSLILALAIISGQLIKIPVFGSSGVITLDIAVAALCLLGSYKLKFKLKKPPLFTGTASVFILIAILSLVLTPLNLSFSEYLTSFFYTVRFTMYVFLGWIIFSGAFPGLRNDIPLMLLFSGLGLAVLGLLQFIFLPDMQFLAKSGWDPHYYRIVSTFLDPNFAGAYFALTLLLLTSHLGGLKQLTLFQRVNYNQIRDQRIALNKVNPRNTMTRRVLYVAFAIIYIALLTTFSRSSYLTLLVGGLTFSFLKKSKSLVVLTILLFGVLMLGFYIYTVTISQPRNIDRTQSASSRFSTWQQGFTLLQKSPISGIGYNAYRYGLKEYSLGDEQFLNSHGSSSNDSSLLFVAATTGIVGLIAYLYFLWTLVKFSCKKNLILISGLVGLIIHSFFANSLFYPPILIWIILISCHERN